MDRQLTGELEKLKKELEGYYQSEANRKDQSLAVFMTEALKIDKAHNMLAEIDRLTEIGKKPSVLPVSDLEPAIAGLKKGISWEIPDFLSLWNLIKAGEELSEQLSKVSEAPLIQDLVLDIKPLDDLNRSFEYSFSPEGEVLDTASGTLAQIRKELRQVISLESGAINRAKAKYKNFLSLPDPVVRNGRETLAVDSNKKGDVPGIVIDRSKTGETLFVLPYEILELENRKEKLIGDEKAEIDNILQRLSKNVYDRLPIIERNYYSYNQIDEWTAKDSFGNSYDGCVAQTVPDTMSLVSFIHPLLDLTKAVPNSLTLGGGTPRILVISGPNAGGKSVMLKGLAISCFMNQCGLKVPAREAKLPVFDNIFVLTGDSESLAGNLSSFSGHLKGLKEMYENATSRSFVLVDEIGQGTAPEDGEAIGFAFIKHMQQLHAFGIFTTHYDGLKKMAEADEGILSGAMEFSTDRLQPTFRFLPGAVGNSYAFEVAAQSGIPAEMLEAAKAYKSNQKSFDVEKLEQQLTAKIQRSNELEKKLTDRLAEANRLIEKRENAIKALEEQKNNIARKADKKVQDLAQQRMDELDSLWKQGQNKSLPFNEKARLKGQMRKTAGLDGKEEESETESDQSLKPGDTVVYNNMTGILSSISKNKATFTYNGFSMTVNLADLRKSETANIPLIRKSGRDIDSATIYRATHTSTRLNVIGLTVAEAIPQVDKFISDALVARLSQVTIVHGMGTFALRNGIREHLKHLKWVKSWREAGEGEGAMGATVVILK